MDKKNNNKNVKNFGKGYPTPLVDRLVQFNVLCEEKEISPSIDVVDMFRIQYEGDEDDLETPVRWRSDVSMLFHAEESIKKLGPEGFRYLSESRRTKTSAVQQMYDQMSDDDLLATVKSRHIQSPSELLAWSASLNDIASQLESQALEETASSVESKIESDQTIQSSNVE
ncbi:internal scaffolding protein [Dipodfec virus UOA04_Rod_499]|nr:internal scaffolding protein [Dipodfec virus UOA04_Rod_499]